MSHHRHENNSTADSMGLMESWMHAAFRIMQNEPQPEDQPTGLTRAYMTIKGHWEDMAFMRLPLTSDVTVTRIKRNMELVDVDPRIVRAFDAVRVLYPDATGHAPKRAVMKQISEIAPVQVATPYETAANEASAGGPSVLTAVA
jgi:hypothetical protein